MFPVRRSSGLQRHRVEKRRGQVAPAHCAIDLSERPSAAAVSIFTRSSTLTSRYLLAMPLRPSPALPSARAGEFSPTLPTFLPLSSQGMHPTVRLPHQGEVPLLASACRRHRIRSARCDYLPLRIVDIRLRKISLAPNYSPKVGLISSNQTAAKSRWWCLVQRSITPAAHPLCRVSIDCILHTLPLSLG